MSSIADTPAAHLGAAVTTTPRRPSARGASARPGLTHLTRLRAAAPLGGLLALAAFLYLWGLAHNGYANTYYAAAVQAGTHSWKAFLFGSLDAANYITVDKPPASLWLMELSSRALGFSSFSMLLPEALAGVASVGLLFATVRRWFGTPAAFLSGLALAVTPVAALMFRFNNPDALLVLLLITAAYGVTRAIEAGRTRWLVLAGSAIGLAFLTKMLQGFLLLPALLGVYLIAAPVPLHRRLAQLAAGGLGLIASAGWWIALVELWPASARPYIGGSSGNSILQLVLGYNGLDRISGSTGGPGGGFSGSAGLLRLFDAQMGGQISWLLPAALIALTAGAVATARRPRTDRLRAAVILWGVWLLVTGAVYSFMSGVVHPYYTNTLAPAIAVLVGVGSVLLFQARDRLQARLVLAAMIAATAVWSFLLLDRAASWHPWLRYMVLAGGLLAAAGMAGWAETARRAVVRALAAGAVIVSLAGPLAYTASAITTVQSGSNPSAGPATARDGFGAGAPGTARDGVGAVAGEGAPGAARAAFPPSSARSLPSRGSFGSAADGPGGASVSRQVIALLKASSSSYTWAAATTSAGSAAPLELGSGKAVMAVGGFSGNDASTTLARFEQLVAQGRIHYYIAAGAGGPAGGLRSRGGSASVASQIATWVAAHFKASTIGGTTVYDLSQGAAR